MWAEGEWSTNDNENDGPIEEFHVLTAATAPLSLASVKISSSWDAFVALASHATMAIQGVPPGKFKKEKKEKKEKNV